MCTLIALVPSREDLPVVVAANRDEMLDRPSLPFGRHWDGKPWRAGLDMLGGGTWAGVHDGGFGVFVLNRGRSLGPEAGKRSRGLLAIDLLEAGNTTAAVQLASSASPGEYRPFHAVVASNAGVFGVGGGGEDAASRHVAEPGITMWTAHGPNSDASGRQVAHRDAFRSAWDRWHESGDQDALLGELETLLAAPAPEHGSPLDAMCIRAGNFGTRSSLVVAFPKDTGHATDLASVRFTEGAPDRTDFRDA